MRLLERLFGSKGTQLSALKKGRGWTFDVVGESNYQEELSAYYERHGGNGSDLIVQSVVLRAEDNNPHDSKAVRVELQGRAVGYLPRARAAEYRAALSDTEALKNGATCSAKVTGGFEMDDDLKGRDRAHFGLKLNVSWPPKLAGS